ncbi:GOLPH3/VPS74 family protein [Allokutzneria albata]|uniref:Golgi phosphoprotein 3 (GPP34) n=1 Tax=Allokutzneria albata TaxID=211114 RepID=A0A1G9WMV0_ALLAB|nr:GPP34 family phosphoprotein [Allokutzneria albata]SDM85848.1 Golgi phosphoprotein 3 (GPP34) [Allokutzneria albata]
MPLLLADDYYLIAHDDVTGTARCGEGRAGLGLAGALLGELVLFGSIDIERRNIVLLDAPSPGDALARALLEELVRNSDVTSVPDWLQYLSQKAQSQVVQRLLHAGHIRPTEVRRMLQTRTVYVPTDMNVAAWAAARLANALTKNEQLSVPDVVLSGLVVATELEAEVFQHAAHEVARPLRRQLTGLPAALRALLSETEAAVGDAVLRHRR